VVPGSDPDGLNRVLVGQPAHLVDMLGQEVEHQRRDFIDLLVERKMTCVEEVDFGGMVVPTILATAPRLVPSLPRLGGFRGHGRSRRRRACAHCA
jgi:hypothetical protein